tara:strand:+ start:823 stop:1278 length:456 start_codon:yes stop_codon:yes gene_type:complete
MKHTEIRSIETHETIAITCDVCKTRYDDPVEMQAFIQILKTGGYGNIFGDGALMECDLCQYCLKERLGDSLRIKHYQVGCRSVQIGGVVAGNIQKITERANAVFGSPEIASRWLNKPRKKFKDRSAIDLALTEAGAKVVAEELERIDSGYF